MLHFIETHGFEFLAGYFVFACIVSTMPPLQPNAGYYARWAHDLLHVLASNLKPLADSLRTAQIPVLPNSTTVKTETNQIVIENKTDKKE